MSLACLLLLNLQLFSSILSAKWLNQQARFLKLFKHGDAKLSPAVLIQSAIETFTEQGVQSGAPNSFNIAEIGKTYNKNVGVWNAERGEHRRPKLQKLSLQTIRYYISKPAFLDMAIKVFHRVRDAALKRKGLERDLALLEAVNNCLADDCQLQDIVCFDGCYKHVHKDLAEPFKGTRNNSKRQVDQDGNVTKKTNAQLGIQVGFSLIKRLPISVDVTSATYNERESVSLSPNTLVICDAGYLEYQMLAKASEYNAFLLVNGKFNMRGRIKNIFVDEVDKTSEYGGLDLQDKRIRDIPNSNNLDMQVEVSYKEKISETQDVKPKFHTKKLCIRVIRYHDKRQAKKRKPGFLVTNLPSDVPCNIVQRLMRTRWSIENYFKELKSCTRYRGAKTNSESLTVALVYLSLTAHLCREMAKYAIEEQAHTNLSVLKLARERIETPYASGTLSLLMVKLFSPILTESRLQKLSKVLAATISNMLDSLTLSRQSKQNKYKSLTTRIFEIVMVSINANPYKRDTSHLDKMMKLLQKMT